MYSPFRKIRVLADLCPQIFYDSYNLLYPLVSWTIQPQVLILSVDFTDANNLLAGVINLKGFKVSKSKSIDDCLSIITQIDGQNRCSFNR